MHEFAKYPKVYPVVDIAVFAADGMMLVAKKKNQTGLRFPGGFVDTSDDNVWSAGSRELLEETGLFVSNSELDLFTSMKIDDPRLVGTNDVIMTTGLGVILSKPSSELSIKANDDIVWCGWVDPFELVEKKFLYWEFSPGCIDKVEYVHRDLFLKAIEWYFESL